MYGCNYPKLPKKFIKQEQISNYVISRRSELSSGPQSPEFSRSENAVLKYRSQSCLAFLQLVKTVILGDLKRSLLNGHYIHFYKKNKWTIIYISAYMNNLCRIIPFVRNNTLCNTKIIKLIKGQAFIFFFFFFFASYIRKSKRKKHFKNISA